MIKVRLSIRKECQTIPTKMDLSLKKRKRRWPVNKDCIIVNNCKKLEAKAKKESENNT
jgi:hypothetical protein